MKAKFRLKRGAKNQSAIKFWDFFGIFLGFLFGFLFGNFWDFFGPSLVCRRTSFVLCDGEFG